MNVTDVIRRPLITEKTSILREDGKTIVFDVARDANKIDIKRAVEQLFGAKVASVRTLSRTARSSGRDVSPDAGPTGRRRTSGSVTARSCRSSWKARRAGVEQWLSAVINRHRPGAASRRCRTIQRSRFRGRTSR